MPSLPSKLYHTTSLVLLLVHLHLLTTPTFAMTTTPTNPNRVAVVTGASRGIGRGIAVELGRAGYTVYALGRGTRTPPPRNTPPPPDRLGLGAGLDLTVESVAEEITAFGNGGIGYPVAVDLTDDGAMERVLADVAEREGGRLDLIVCSAYGVPSGGKLRDDFWKQGMEMWDEVNELGLRQVYNACCNAVPYMINTAAASSPSGTTTTPLICLVSSFGGKAYTFNVAYGVGKAAIDRLAADMAFQLKPHSVATTALYPGLVKTEGNLRMETDGTWDEASGGLDLSVGETPEFSGRAVVALAGLGREELMERSGRVEVVAELAEELGFTEEDGSRPCSIRSLRYILPNFVFPQVEKESGKPVPGWVRDNVPDWLLPWKVFSSPPPVAEE